MNTLGTIRYRDMSGEAEVEDGYTAVYEVIINARTPQEDSFGTLDIAPVGSQHRLQSWCGEYENFRGGRGIPKKWVRSEIASFKAS